MTNREWKLLISKEFDVSMNVANKMLHSMYMTKNILDNTNTRMPTDKPRNIRGLRRINYNIVCNKMIH